MSPDTVTRTEIRPFQIDVPQQEVDELRRRIGATRWPSRELVADRSQGVQLATTQELARFSTTALRSSTLVSMRHTAAGPA